MDIEEKIVEIEKEIRETPYHKGTEHHVGRLRARLVQLKDELLNRSSKKSAGGSGFAQKKTGDATVALVGPPSVGKSSLINVLTEAHSKVAAYDFTTLEVIPGMMNYQGAQIQIFDIPGIIEGASLGKGRGKEVLSVVRAADLLMLMIDVSSAHLIELLKKELFLFGLRLDEEAPKVFISEKNKGGLKVTATTPLSNLSRKTIKEVASQFRIHNAEITIKENLTLERLIDAFMGNRVYLPYLIVVNKIDLSTFQRYPEKEKIFISVKNRQGLEDLKEAIWQKLELIRIYLKHDAQVDYNEPLILRQGSTILDAAKKISLELAEEIYSAQIWGSSAKFPGQIVSLSHQLYDKDILYLIKKGKKFITSAASRIPRVSVGGDETPPERSEGSTAT